MSQEDERRFDRWLKANAAFGLLFYAGIIVLALAGPRSTGPHDAAVASSMRASDVATAAYRRRQTPGAVTAPAQLDR
jgi:hypothetical protein